MKSKADFEKIYETLLAMDCTTDEGRKAISHFIKTETKMCEMGINTLRETIVKLNKKAVQFHF